MILRFHRVIIKSATKQVGTDDFNVDVGINYCDFISIKLQGEIGFSHPPSYRLGTINFIELKGRDEFMIVFGIILISN